MAISTANTILKYGVSQVERATVVGTITTAGNATFTITGAGITGSPVAISVAVLLGDSAFAVAEKAVAAIKLNAAVSALYEAYQKGNQVFLRRKVAAANDATLNIAYTNGTCAGLTPAATSTDVTAGVALQQLSPIVSYPDMGSAPSKLDTTDLSQTVMKTSIFGLQEAPDLNFEANYDKSVMGTIASLTSTYCLQLSFSSAEGAFVWQGEISAFATGGAVDEVRKMNIITSVVSPILFYTT